MKKLVSLLLILSIMLTACSGEAAPPSDNGKGDDIPPAVTPPEDDPDNSKEDKKDMGVWHTGYIGSDKNEKYPATVNTNEKSYIYSDVIELEKAGTSVTFTANTDVKSIYDTYLVSSWKKTDGVWVIDPDGPSVDNESGLVYTSNGDGTSTYTYVSTADGECIRFCYCSGNPAFMDVIYPELTVTYTGEQGTVADIMESKAWCISDRERAYYSILEGKKISFIGDSLFAGNSLGNHLVWPALLGMKYSMSFRNYGISGCTLSACEGGKNAIINRYSGMAGGSPDIVVFEGGRNDYNKCAELGTLDSTDTTTYRGALNELIKGLREKYPNAVIIGVTFWKANDRLNDAGVNCNEYNAAMLEVCANMGIPCIDATNEDECGIRMTDKSFRLEYSMQAGDVCHLNKEGMRLALTFFERKIAEIYSASVTEK